MPVVDAAEHTILQTVVAPARQGRVFGFAQCVEQAGSPITGCLMGGVQTAVGPRSGAGIAVGTAASCASAPIGAGRDAPRRTVHRAFPCPWAMVFRDADQVRCPWHYPRLRCLWSCATAVWSVAQRGWYTREPTRVSLSGMVTVPSRRPTFVPRCAAVA